MCREKLLILGDYEKIFEWNSWEKEYQERNNPYLCEELDTKLSRILGQLIFFLELQCSSIEVWVKREFRDK